MNLFEMFLLEDRIDFLKQKYADVLSDEQFNKIVEADPTKNKIYVQWLLLKYKKENPSNYFDDLYKYNEYLDVFDRLKNKFPEKDINKYTYQSLKDEVLKIQSNTSGIELKKGIEKSDKFAEYRIGKVGEYDVYKIKQDSGEYDVSCELGSGTQWCTATGKTQYHFNTYNSKSDLYIFINSSDKKDKYQLSLQKKIESDDRELNLEFRDRNDNSVIEYEVDEDRYGETMDLDMMESALDENGIDINDFIKKYEELYDSNVIEDLIELSNSKDDEFISFINENFTIEKYKLLQNIIISYINNSDYIDYTDEKYVDIIAEEHILDMLNFAFKDKKIINYYSDEGNYISVEIDKEISFTIDDYLSTLFTIYRDNIKWNDMLEKLSRLYNDFKFDSLNRKIPSKNKNQLSLFEMLKKFL